jgi:uncharacterized protein YlxW (UPF0749 family)
MKTKFEENVASESPRASGSTEPELPWKVSDDDVIESVDAKEEAYRSAVAGAPPLKIRAILIILLILSVFAFVSNTVTNMAIDKYQAETSSVALKATLVKTAGEKNALNESASQLEKRVGELTAQKELYTTVLETLAKKPDDAGLTPANGAKNPE